MVNGTPLIGSSHHHDLSHRISSQYRDREGAAPPNWGSATADRGATRPDAPILLIDTRNNVQIIAACSDDARARGIRPGMTLAHATALLPNPNSQISNLKSEIPSVVLPHDPATDLTALNSLALWAMRFSPTIAIDPPGGLLLDITGCQRLFRGEANLLHQALDALCAMGFTVRGAIADTIGAAWALSHGGPDARTIVPEGQTCSALSYLRPWTLRLIPEIVTQLDALGIERIEALLMLPRSTLPSRFGDLLLLRLDQALGRVPEVLDPVRPPIRIAARMNFEEPTERRELLEWALQELIQQITRQLTQQGSGARRLELMLFQFRSTPAIRTVTLCAPSRSIRHLTDLLRPQLECIDARTGIDGIMLAAPDTARISPAQAEFLESQDIKAHEESTELFDRLGARLGRQCIIRPQPVESHWPERAWTPAQPRSNENRSTGNRPDTKSSNENRSNENPFSFAPRRESLPTPSAPTRPLRILPHPQPLQAIALVPDGPPILLRGGGREHHIRHAAGPERLMAEWWAGQSGGRDYFRVEDDTGACLWVFRESTSNQWYLHGVFE